jgi:ParB/RepB/Spo0J family partition protein
LNAHDDLRRLPLDHVREPDSPSRLAMDDERLAELASSMARLGLLEPIGVQPIDGTDDYRILYGHRRYLAARSLGWYDIPALVLSAHLSEQEARQAENNQRVELTPVEEARELKRYHDAGEPLVSIAHRVNRSPTWVAQRLRLLNYQDDILDAIHEHHLTLSVADLLTQITDDRYRRLMIDEALRNGATANTASAWVQHYLTEAPRLAANMATVEEIASRRNEYVIMTPCEYCRTPTPLENTRVWRLCLDDHDALTHARDNALTQETTRV